MLYVKLVTYAANVQECLPASKNTCMMEIERLTNITLLLDNLRQLSILTKQYRSSVDQTFNRFVKSLKYLDYQDNTIVYGPVMGDLDAAEFIVDQYDDWQVIKTEKFIQFIGSFTRLTNSVLEFVDDSR